MDDQELQDVAIRRARRWWIASWIACVWLIGWCGMIVTEAVSWTDTRAGAMNGLTVGGILSPFLLIVTLPIGLVGMWIGHFRPLRRWRWWISLGAVAGVFLWDLAERVLDRIDPRRVFERCFEIPFPENATLLESSSAGGLLADSRMTFRLRSSREGIDTLLQDLGGKRDGRSGGAMLWVHRSNFNPHAWGWGPAYETYSPVEEPEGHVFWSVCTDLQHREAFVVWGTY